MIQKDEDMGSKPKKMEGKQKKRKIKMAKNASIKGKFTVVIFIAVVEKHHLCCVTLETGWVIIFTSAETHFEL